MFRVRFRALNKQLLFALLRPFLRERRQAVLTVAFYINRP